MSLHTIEESADIDILQGIYQVAPQEKDTLSTVYAGEDPFIWRDNNGIYHLIQISYCDNHNIYFKAFNPPPHLTCSLDECEAVVTRRSTARLEDVFHATEMPILQIPLTSRYSKQVWAFEEHPLLPEDAVATTIDEDFIRKKTLLVGAVCDGNNCTHHTVLYGPSENESTAYEELCHIWDADAPTGWNIDMTFADILHNGEKKRYAIWSTQLVPENDFPQVIRIAEFPYTLAQLRELKEFELKGTLLTSPEYTWEMSDAAVNEGPQAVYCPEGEFKGIMYAANASWTRNYTQGFLSYIGGDPANILSYIKAEKPITMRNDGYGHGCTVVDRDGLLKHIGHYKIAPDTPGWQRAISLPSDVIFANGLIQIL